MSETLHANIFFFITSVAVVALTLMGIVVLWYVIAILREVRAIVVRVRKASDGLQSDIEYLRAEVKSVGGRVMDVAGILFNFFGSMASIKKRATVRRRTKETTDTESV